MFVLENAEFEYNLMEINDRYLTEASICEIMCMEGMMDGFKKNFDNLKDAISDMYDNLKDNITRVRDSALEKVDAFKSEIDKIDLTVKAAAKLPDIEKENRSVEVSDVKGCMKVADKYIEDLRSLCGKMDSIKTKAAHNAMTDRISDLQEKALSDLEILGEKRTIKFTTKDAKNLKKYIEDMKKTFVSFTEKVLKRNDLDKFTKYVKESALYEAEEELTEIDKANIAKSIYSKFTSFVSAVVRSISKGFIRMLTALGKFVLWYIGEFQGAMHFYSSTYKANKSIAEKNKLEMKLLRKQLSE